jgi:phospholipid-binding lipoprotein MlaA
MRKYGMKPGPYLVLPILGPSSVRDTAGLAADFGLDPTTYVFKKNSKLFKRSGKFLKNNNKEVLIAAKVTDGKNQGMSTIKQIEQVALDDYATIRNLYSQKYR